MFRATALLLTLSCTAIEALAQDAVAYRLSEPDAAEGTRLHTQYQLAKQAFDKWKAEISAKYSSGGKPLEFTFDFRIGVPKKEDQNAPKHDTPTPSVWSDSNNPDPEALTVTN